MGRLLSQYTEFDARPSRRVEAGPGAFARKNAAIGPGWTRAAPAGAGENIHKVWYIYRDSREPAGVSEEPTDESSRISRSIRAVQETVEQAGPAASAGYTLVGAVLLLGAAGYGLDKWLGTSPWCLLGGFLLGMFVGFYELIKTTGMRR
jgi:F0F1-type ATP synthase assembly protein I